MPGSPISLMKFWRGIIALLVYSAACSAQTPPALKSVIGEVTSIDAASKQIKLKADDGAVYTVALANNTAVLRVPPGETDLKKATKIAFAEVMVGDRALARVPPGDPGQAVAARTIVIMTKADLAKKHEHDRAEWQQRGMVGVVTALDPATKQVTITTRGRESKTVTIDVSAASFRRYSPESVKFADAKPSSFTELEVGDTVRALGDKNEDGTHLKAEEVVAGSFQTIAGTVDSVDAAASEVRITNLLTKKPMVVRVNQDSLTRKLDPAIAAMLARRLRPQSADGQTVAGGARPEGARPEGAPSAGEQGPPGGFRGGFGGGRGPGGGGDLQQILERMPQLSLADLKKGDAVIVSSSKTPGDTPVTAFAFVAGVEPFLAAAPRTSGQVNLGSWNLDLGGGPEE